VAQAVAAYRDPKELFGVLTAELRKAVDFDFVGLFLYDEAAHKFENPVFAYPARARGGDSAGFSSGTHHHLVDLP